MTIITQNECKPGTICISYLKESLDGEPGPLWAQSLWVDFQVWDDELSDGIEEFHLPVVVVGAETLGLSGSSAFKDLLNLNKIERDKSS